MIQFVRTRFFSLTVLFFVLGLLTQSSDVYAHGNDYSFEEDVINNRLIISSNGQKPQFLNQDEDVYLYGFGTVSFNKSKLKIIGDNNLSQTLEFKSLFQRLDLTNLKIASLVGEVQKITTSNISIEEGVKFKVWDWDNYHGVLALTGKYNIRNHLNNLGGIYLTKADVTFGTLRNAGNIVVYDNLTINLEKYFNLGEVTAIGYLNLKVKKGVSWQQLQLSNLSGNPLQINGVVQSHDQDIHGVKSSDVPPQDSTPKEEFRKSSRPDFPTHTCDPESDEEEEVGFFDSQSLLQSIEWFFCNAIPEGSMYVAKNNGKRYYTLKLPGNLNRAQLIIEFFDKRKIHQTKYREVPDLNSNDGTYLMNDKGYVMWKGDYVVKIECPPFLETCSVYRILGLGETLSETLPIIEIDENLNKIDKALEEGVRQMLQMPFTVPIVQQPR